MPSPVIRTASPGPTSRSSCAPIWSNAQVSDATHQPASGSRPITSGRTPNGSRNATSSCAVMATTEKAPARRGMAAATASRREPRPWATAAAMSSESVVAFIATPSAARAARR